jgi:hypothetical protein
MTGMKGPGIFLAQFLGDKAPFDTLDGLAEWAGSAMSGSRSRATRS